MAVFVLDQSGKPLMPCSEKRARLMLERGRARIHRILPFVIRLVDRKAGESGFQSLRLKLDPGSKTTGIALVLEKKDSIAALNLFELVHRGRQISEALMARSQMRRGRRTRNLRYRTPRFLNRGNKASGWLAPSLMHRVHTTMSWVNRVQRWAPVSAISTELVKFDMLCAYCDKQDLPLQTEHIEAKSNGGSNRVSNLTLACQTCNQKKGSQDIREFLKRDPARLARITAKAKAPLRDAAAANATRWKLLESLKETGLSVETGTGGRTKFNRSRLGVPKTHALDAVCVGQVEAVTDWQRPTLEIKCSGRGSYQRTRLTAHGFPRGYLMRGKSVHGFQTGDMVKAEVPDGKKAGTHVGRVAIRASGSFNIQTSQCVVQGIAHRYCKVVQRADGYGYSTVAFTESEQVSHQARIAPQSALYLLGMNAGISRAK